MVMGDRRYTSLLGAMVVLGLCTGAVADAPAKAKPEAPKEKGAKEAPAAKPKEVPAELTALIHAIEKADAPPKALSAFSRGRAIDRNSVKLYQTYMEKMLGFGYPRLASYAARELTRLTPKDGVAWSVIAYQSAKQGRITEALTPVIRAASLMPDDASTRHNISLILGWYAGHDMTPRVPKALEADFNKHQGTWKSGPYGATLNGFKKLAREKEARKAAIATQEGKIQELLTEARACQRSIRANNTGVARLEKENTKSQAEVALIRRREDRNNRLIAYERRLQGTIDGNKREISKLNRDSNTKRDRLKKITSDYQKAKEQLEKARADAEKTSPPEMSWEPPAAGGKVTPDVEADGKIKPFPVNVPDDPEKKASAASEADRALQMAKMLLVNGFEDKALRSLKLIVLRYPKTKAAAEAARLIGRINPDEAPPVPATKPVPKPPPEPKPPAPPQDPEKMLQDARTLIREDKTAEATKILTEIVTRHADSPAVKEARLLLKALEGAK